MVEMNYKHWCEDEMWQPLDEDSDDKEDDSDDESGKNNQLYIFKESYVPLPSLPLVSPKLDSQFETTYGRFVETAIGLSEWCE